MLIQDSRRRATVLALAVASLLGGIGSHAGGADKGNSLHHPVKSAESTEGDADMTMAASAAEQRHFVIYNNYRILFETPSRSADGIDDAIDGEVQKALLSLTTLNLAYSFAVCSMRTLVTHE